MKTQTSISDNLVDPELLSKNKYFDAEHLGLDIGLAMSSGFAIMLVVDFIFSEMKARKLSREGKKRKLSFSDDNHRTLLLEGQHGFRSADHPFTQIAADDMKGSFLMNLNSVVNDSHLDNDIKLRTVKELVMLKESQCEKKRNQSHHDHVHGDKENALVTTMGLVIHSISDGVALAVSLYCKFRSSALNSISL